MRWRPAGRWSRCSRTLSALARRDAGLGEKLRPLGREDCGLIPARLGDRPEDAADCQKVLQELIDLRNGSAHDPPVVPDVEEVARRLGRLHAFLCACQTGGYYPEVLRYDGTFENRNGERFVLFLDEKGRERKVRSDEKIDPRRHYYCFATNNPVHLFPTLIPKL